MNKQSSKRICYGFNRNENGELVVNKDAINVLLIFNQYIQGESIRGIINFLKDNQEIPVGILLDATGTTAAVLKTLESKGIVEFFEMEVLRNPFFLHLANPNGRQEQ